MIIRIWIATFLVLCLAVMGYAQQSSGVISEIVVTGNTVVTKDAILARMKTKVGQPYNQAQLDADRAAVEQLGYFKAVTIQATPLEGSNMRVTVNVSEFAVVKEIRVVGNTVIPTDKILKVLPIQVGQPFNLTWQQPSGIAVAKLYNDKGYIALLEEAIPLEDSPGTVSLVVREMKVNSITISGNTRTKQRILKRLIKTRPGEAYNTKKFDDDLLRMRGTRWFDKVDPSEKQTEEGFGVDLGVDVKEARTGQAVIGVTLDPRNSFAGQVGLSDSNVNGTGQNVGINFSQAISGGGLSAELNYTNPFIDNRDTSLSLSVYSRLIYRFTGTGFGNDNSPTNSRYTERRTGASMSVARPVGVHAAASAGFKFEGIKTSNLDTTNQNGFIQQDGTVAIGSLGYNRNRRDVDVDPSRGDWFNLLVEPGFSHITEVGGAIPDTSILGNHTFVRSSIEYRTYFTNQPPRGRQFDAPRRVLAFRIRYGEITGKVPFFEQFFAGGSDSVRGYPDDRFWGKQLLVTNLEYRYPLQKAFNIIAFVDYGGAWGGYGSVNNFTQSDKFKLHLGYGLGVGFKTPLGPIRLDLGFNERGGSRTHFLIGYSF